MVIHGSFLLGRLLTGITLCAALSSAYWLATEGGDDYPPLREWIEQLF